VVVLAPGELPPLVPPAVAVVPRPQLVLKVLVLSVVPAAPDSSVSRFPESHLRAGMAVLEPIAKLGLKPSVQYECSSFNG